MSVGSSLKIVPVKGVPASRCDTTVRVFSGKPRNAIYGGAVERGPDAFSFLTIRNGVILSDAAILGFVSGECPELFYGRGSRYRMMQVANYGWVEMFAKYNVRAPYEFDVPQLDFCMLDRAVSSDEVVEITEGSFPTVPMFALRNFSGSMSHVRSGRCMLSLPGGRLTTYGLDVLNEWLDAAFVVLRLMHADAVGELKRRTPAESPKDKPKDKPKKKRALAST